MRLGLLLAFVPAVALAAGPMVLPSPDLRALSAGPMVSQSRDTGTTCTFRPGFTGCSDGRTITTTRASAVPCETAPGVWTYAPAGTACVSVRGLESWGANTTQIANGHRLDQAPWSVSSTTVTPIGSIWRATPSSSGGFIRNNRTNITAGTTHTAACKIRQGTGRGLQLVPMIGSVGSGCPRFEVTEDWNTYSCTSTATVDGEAGLFLYPGRDTIGYSDVAACWHVTAPTPGRPCWQASGAAPFTCAADVHTISTEGWPTEEGEICVGFVIGASGGGTRTLVDARTAGQSGYLRVYVSNGNAVTVLVGGVAIGSSPLPAGEHRACVEFTTAATQLKVDGAVVSSGDPVALGAAVAAFLGGNYVGAEHLNGSIHSLSWRTP